MGETDSRIVDLPPVVDLDALDGVRDRLLDAIDAGPVTVSGAQVERVSTNALFLLLSAAETARRSNTAFTLGSVSASLTSAIERLGLGPHFGALTKGER
jgi:anti-anti-sigma regulatory factor